MTSRTRYIVLVTAFLGWYFAGIEMSLMPLAARTVAQDLLGSDFTEAQRGSGSALRKAARRTSDQRVGRKAPGEAAGPL